MKTTFAKLATASIFGAAIAVFTSGAASAYVVCNHEGDCWHSDQRYRYHDVRVDVHPDNWYFHRDWDHDRDYHWRGHHDGRGYWRNGVWIQF